MARASRAAARRSSGSATSPPPTWPASRAGSSARTSSPWASASATPTSARSSRPSWRSASEARRPAAPDPAAEHRRRRQHAPAAPRPSTSSTGRSRRSRAARCRAIPARRDSPVDIVPVDYVADRVHELATDGPDGTFHLVAGRNATTVGRLLELSSERARPPGADACCRPRLYRRWLHPLLRRRKPARSGEMEVYFPYFAMRVRFDDRRLGPGPRVERYFHRLVRYAERARLGPAASPTLSRVIEKLVEQIEGRFAELSEQMSDPEVISDQRRYAEVGRAYRALEPAQRARPGMAPRDRRRRRRARAARRGRRRPGAARARCSTSEERLAELEEEIRLAMVEPDPNDDKDVIVEIRPGAGGEEAGPVRRRPLPDARPLRRAARLQDRADRGGRRPLHLRRQGPGRVQRLQVRGRHAPRAARARDRVAGPHPHLDRDGRGAAGGRGRGRADRPERPPDRRLPLVGARAGSR